MVNEGGASGRTAVEPSGVLSRALHEELSRCRLCPWECGVNRLRGEHGFCGLDTEGRIFADFVHLGEERRLVPSYLVCFTGCNFRCAFCVNLEWVSRPAQGPVVDVPALRSRITALARRGVRTVSLLGGEPTCNLPVVARVFEGFQCPLPVVWNSNMYFSPRALPFVLAFADVFLADFKFGNDSCAERVSGAPRYTSTVRANLLAVAARRDLIVRHLLLPGHFECCTIPILDWLASNLPCAEVNVLGSFLPRPDAALGSPLSRTVAASEFDRAVRHARRRRLRLVDR